MKPGPTILCLPIEDRRTSHSFYTRLGLVAHGVLADDGLPEPLQFQINDNVRVMLIPTEGFGWVTGNHEVARRGVSECVVTLSLPSSDDVDDVIGRARAAGGEIVTEPGQQSWGYTGIFADPDGHLWQVAESGGFLTT